jgi:uncharacterized membrane protein YdjX (TVP38/TMEM64 family)
MTDPSSPTAGGQAARFSVRRMGPLVVIVLVIGAIYAMGWHRELSLETLVRHRSVIDDFVAQHRVAAVAAFIALYIAVAALSLPAGAGMTTIGGFLFGAIVGGLSAMLGATIGATIIFLIAKSAVGEHLVRRAGPRVAKFAEGFRADAFSYMLFLRLVPFPFWLVNLAPALFGVRLRTFVVATAIGIIPATFAFAFFGAGLGSAISAQEHAYKACLAAGRADCGVEFNPAAMLTPELLAALALLAAVGLIPVVVKKICRRRAANDAGRAVGSASRQPMADDR